MPGIELVMVLFILFVAAVVKSILGFGESLLAIPLLTLLLGVQVAVPLVGLIVATITVLMMIRNWQHIDFFAIWQLTVAAVVGVPLGVWGLKQLPEAWVTSLLGWVLVGVGLYYLRRPIIKPMNGNLWTIGFGLLSGLFGGAYNIAGAPIIVYGAMRQWSPEDFRGTLQSYFLVVSTTILIGHASAGLWTPTVWRFFVFSVPVMILGFGLGSRYGERLPRIWFERLLYVTLVVLGVALLV